MSSKTARTHARESARGVEMLSQGELAECFGVSRPRISALTADGTLITSHGRYPLRANAGRMVAYLRKRGVVAGARERKLDLESQLLQVKLDKERGQLVGVDTVLAAWQDLVLRARTRLLAIPSKISPRLLYCKSEADFEREILSELQEALLSVSSFDGRQSTAPASVATAS